MALGINQQLNDRGLEVQKAVVDVRRAGEELLSRNVHIIRKQNDGMWPSLFGIHRLSCTNPVQNAT